MIKKNADIVVLDGSCNLIEALDGDCSMLSLIDGCVDKVIEVSHSVEYEGPYTVVPAVVGRVLYTEGKTMSHDVTVKEIPTFQTSNTAGGKTFYIAHSLEV